MITECKRNWMKFQDFGKRKVVGHFDGGTISSAIIKIIVT